MSTQTATQTTDSARAAAQASAAQAGAVLYNKPKFWKTEMKRLKKFRKLIWFVVPAAAFAFVFSYIPMLGILFSFKGKEFNLTTGDVIFNLTQGTWTFQNYLDIFSTSWETFGLAVGNTLLINVIRLVLCFPFSIIVAIQLADLKNQTLSKTILIIICIPNFLSWAIVIGIWAGFLDVDIGLLKVLNALASNKNMIASDNWFKPLAIIWSAWKGVGWGCILYYAAIMSIDKTFYESATIDGANKLQKAWYLTVPSIIGTIALMLVMNISGMMAAGFEQIWTMMEKGGGTLDYTQITLDTYIYQVSIVDKTDIPFATALGVFNGLICLILMVAGNAITSKTLHRGLW